MLSTNIGVILLVLAVAGSYGWAVRGTTIGKEKGALLPGALLGIFLAWFTGSPVIRENFWIFCAAGALGMAVGGTETYAQTMGFVLSNKEDRSPRKGNLGLALKGFLWFGIFGAVLGMAFTAAAGTIYRVWEIAALFATMPFVRALGIRIFNLPFDAKKGVFPKVYLSRNRFEEWGGMLAMLLELAVFLAVKGDSFALILAGCSALGGAVGWVLAINMMRVSMYPKKNGRYIFGSLQTKGMIDNWKIMEYTLGAVGALGAGAGFVLGFPALRPHITAIEAAGKLWSPLLEIGAERILTWIVIALLFAGEPLLGWLFGIKLKDRTKNIERLGDIAEQVLYTYLALPLVLLGAVDFSRVVSILVLYWVLMIEMMFNGDKLPSVKGNLKFRWPIALIGVFYLALEICYHAGWTNITLFTPLFLCLAVYYLVQIFFYDLLPHRMQAWRETAKKEGTGLRPRHFGPMLTQEGFKLITMVFLWIAAWKLNVIG